MSIFDAATGKTMVRLPRARGAAALLLRFQGGQLFVTGDGMDAVVIVFPYSTEVDQTILAGGCRCTRQLGEFKSKDANRTTRVEGAADNSFEFRADCTLPAPSSPAFCQHLSRSHRPRPQQAISTLQHVIFPARNPCFL